MTHNHASRSKCSRPPSVYGRRHWLHLVGAVAATSMCPQIATAASSRAQRRLQNRVDLWHGYAQRTANLRARYQLTRHTSIMQHPLVATGTLVFVAPEQLVFYDDSEAGSRTEIQGQQMWMTPRSDKLTGAAPREATDAARWLSDRFHKLFAPTTPEDFLADASISIPRGSGMRLTFLPPEGSPVRRELRTLQVRFDPVSGLLSTSALRKPAAIELCWP